MNTLQIQLTPDLQRELDLVNKKLDQLQKTMQPKQPEELMTRQSVADYFHVDLSTIYNWTKAGKLSPHAMSGRVYYKRSEVEAAIVKL